MSGFATIAIYLLECPTSVWQQVMDEKVGLSLLCNLQVVQSLTQLGTEMESY